MPRWVKFIVCLILLNMVSLCIEVPIFTQSGDRRFQNLNGGQLTLTMPDNLQKECMLGSVGHYRSVHVVFQFSCYYFKCTDRWTDKRDYEHSLSTIVSFTTLKCYRCYHLQYVCDSTCEVRLLSKDVKKIHLFIVWLSRKLILVFFFYKAHGSLMNCDWDATWWLNSFPSTFVYILSCTVLYQSTIHCVSKKTTPFLFL